MAPLASEVDNLSLVLHGKDDLRLEQKPLPSPPGENEVMLATRCVGICGSDVSYWVKGYIGDFVVKSPMIMGHETSAVVTQLGSNVKNLKVGDRVAIEPGVPCRYCQNCKDGNYNLCTSIFFHATPPDDGTLTRYFKHAADFCFKLPDNVSLEEGAMIEPLSVGIHACNRSGVTAGDKVLITGAGPIGILAFLSARAYGATKIVLTDVNLDRLKFAESLGADGTYLHESGKDGSDEIEKLLGGQADKVLECSGHESCINIAVKVCRNGGVIALVGMGPASHNIPLVIVGIKEIDIRGIFRYRHCYPKAIALLEAGKIDIKPLITHRFKLDQSFEAFKTAKSGVAMKVMISCDPEEKK